MSILQKFEKFALTKEQGNVIKGGEWLRCKTIGSDVLVDVWRHTTRRTDTVKENGQMIPAPAVYNCQ